MATLQSIDTYQEPLSHSSGPTVASQVMQNIFGLVSHAWQEEAILHIIALAKDDLHLPFRLVTTAMMPTRQSTDLSLSLPDIPMEYL